MNHCLLHRYQREPSLLNDIPVSFYGLKRPFRICSAIILHSAFERVVMSIITLNTIAMATYYYGMSSDHKLVCGQFKWGEDECKRQPPHEN
jgi:hypothetical protein